MKGKDLLLTLKLISVQVKNGMIITASEQIKKLALYLDRIGYGRTIKELKSECKRLNY